MFDESNKDFKIGLLHTCMHVDLKYYYFCISIISWSGEIQNKGQFLCIHMINSFEEEKGTKLVAMELQERDLKLDRLNAGSLFR